jgi:UPF0716 protein FxsA
MVGTEKQTARRLPIGRILLIAFIVMPIVEIAVLIQVGGWLGLWPTLALIILTAVAGTWMLRQQGFAVLSRAQEQLGRGTVPIAEVFEGFCLVIAGALLLTPGFVTDFMGGLLLLPPVRTWLYGRLGHHLRSSVSHGEAGFHTGPAGSGRPPGGDHDRRPGKGPVVEGDFEAITPEDEPKADKDDDGSEGKPADAAPNRPGGRPMPPPRGSWNDRS